MTECLKVTSAYLGLAEEVLASDAARYCPHGSDIKAVIHQWLNAIAFEQPLCFESEIIIQGSSNQH